MKPKIGVITFHDANNYGAVLQAFALQQELKKIGCNPYIINYKSEYSDSFKNDYKGLKKLLIAPFLNAKKKKFNNFLTANCNFSETVTTENIGELNEKFDILITGSDQVFSEKWRNGDISYFLNFANKDKCYSYSASFGTNTISNDFALKISEYVKKINNISIREETGQKILKEKFNLDSRIDVDPVLLLDKNEWHNIAKKNIKNNYVLIYMLENNKDLIEKAFLTAKERKLKVISITDSLKTHKNGIIYKSFISPQEFVGLFENADCIFTNSFHGFMFSFIFEKEYYLYLQNSNNAPNSRLLDISKRYNLTNFITRSINQDNSDCNFLKAKEILAKHVESSINFLKTITLPKLNLSEYDCTYCTACKEICPGKAIKYISDKKGFKYPTINAELCLRCKKCESVCPMQNKTFHNHILQAYALKNKNLSERLESRSGGLFYLIAKEIINKKGIVYGVILDGNNKAIYSRGTTLTDISKMQKSKYVEPNKEIFNRVLEDLKTGNLVFFSGTPCTIDGLKNLISSLNIKTEKLYLMDIVCHGVNSSLIYTKYLKNQTAKYGTIKNFQFRDKIKGWDNHYESFYTNNDCKIYSKEYASIFYSHWFLRPSCYSCKYSSINRVGDITGADCWGIQNIKDFSDNNGISLVLTNTEKGEKLIKLISRDAEIRKISYKDFLQDNLNHPTSMPRNTDKTWNLFFKKGYSVIAKKSAKLSNKVYRKNKFLKFLSKIKKGLKKS